MLKHTTACRRRQLTAPATFSTDPHALRRPLDCMLHRAEIPFLLSRLLARLRRGAEGRGGGRARAPKWSVTTLSTTVPAYMGSDMLVSTCTAPPHVGARVGQSLLAVVLERCSA